MSSTLTLLMLLHFAVTFTIAGGFVVLCVFYGAPPKNRKPSLLAKRQESQ